MTRNPLINAVAALAYISLVATIMFYGPEKMGQVKTIAVPIAIVSLFTLSAAVMGFIFLFQPAQLYFDNKKKAAIGLFVQTLGSFAVITILIFSLLFLGFFH